MSTAIASPPVSAVRGIRLSTGWVGVLMLLLIAVPCVVTVPWALSPSEQPRYDRQNIEDADAIFAAPSWEHPMGTDDLGRSVLWRCLLGGAISLLIGLSAAALALFIGVTWGMVAGYFGGKVDSAMMRIVDIMYGLPYLLMVVLVSMGIAGLIDAVDRWSLANEQAVEGYEPWVFVSWMRGGQELVNIVTLVVAIGLVSWLTMARVIRGQVLSLRRQPFIEATTALGLSTPRVLARHLLPNLVGPIVVYATLAVPQAILQESFLSFLGIGVRPPQPSWGNLAAEGVQELPSLVSEDLPMHWWLVVFPCLLLGLTLLALNFVGDALQRAFDPRARR